MLNLLLGRESALGIRRAGKFVILDSRSPSEPCGKRALSVQGASSAAHKHRPFAVAVGEGRRQQAPAGLLRRVASP